MILLSMSTSFQKSKNAREEVVRTLKNASKETISVRLSNECIRELSRELSDIKRNNQDMKKLTLPKYISALIEQHANPFMKEGK